MPWDGYEEVHQLLRTGLFHSTSPEGFKGILTTGAIVPNAGQFRHTYPQTAANWGVKRGGICLFDFGAATLEEQYETSDRWGNCAVPFEPVTLILRLDRTMIISGIIANLAARQSTESPKFYIPYVEAWHIGPIPISSVLTISVATYRHTIWKVEEFIWNSEDAEKILRTIQSKVRRSSAYRL